MSNLIQNYALTFEAIAAVKADLAQATKNGDRLAAETLMGNLIALYASIDAAQAAEVLGQLSGGTVIPVDFKKAA